MQFDGIIAIDWSGAKNSKKAIQVARCDNEKQGVKLVNPPHGTTRWTRSHLSEWLVEQLGSQRLLVGFDFAFAYPFCDRGAYFPGQERGPETPEELWAVIENICDPAADFYGGHFYRLRGTPLAEYLQYQDYTGTAYEQRFRDTEKRCRAVGLSPSSAFKCVGPSVGVGSIAGMRFLHRFTKDANVTVWPIERNSVHRESVMVEIFPQVFLHEANALDSRLTKRAQVELAIAHFGFPCEIAASPTEDERDAVISAAAMFRLASEDWPWHPEGVSERILAKEGWIFGVK